MEAQTENDELYPIAVLIDELKVRNRARLQTGILTRSSMMTFCFASMLYIDCPLLRLLWGRSVLVPSLFPFSTVWQKADVVECLISNDSDQNLLKTKMKCLQL